MILKWKDLWYAEHFIDGIEHVALLGTWGLEDWQTPATEFDVVPDYGAIHGCESVFWSDGRDTYTDPREPVPEDVARQLQHWREVGDAHTVFVLTTATITGRMEPRTDGFADGRFVHRMRCAGMWLLNDAGHTVQRLA